MDQRRQADYEAIVKAAWTDALGNQSIAADDDFFLLGGDSFSAVDVVTKVAHGLNLTQEEDFIAMFVALFDHPTLTGFAAAVEAGATS
jgi:nonribosomal peptide synthetase MxcG